MFEDLCKVYHILSVPGSLISIFFNFVYRLSRDLIDFNIPYVIHLDFFYLYLLYFTNSLVMCFFLAVSITSSMTS